MEVDSELIIMDTIVRVLCQCFYVVMEVASKLIMIEMIVRVLCHCLYVVNGGCFGVDNDQNDCESALPLLVHSVWRLLRS